MKEITKTSYMYVQLLEAHKIIQLTASNFELFGAVLYTAAIQNM